MWLRGANAAALVLLCLFALGCEKPLFDSGVQRTPYERYQVLRGQYRVAQETNVYGSEQPALRQRLKPLQ